jgi:WD40 repeat protein
VEHETDVGCVVISEDNEHVVSGAKDGNMIIWKVQTGEIMHKLTGHTDKITAFIHFLKVLGIITQ